jgi:RHS repeat-associated protein
VWEYENRTAATAFTKTTLHVAGPAGRCAQVEKVLTGADATSLPVFHVHGDHLGSGQALTKADGTLLCQEEFFAYGRSSDRRDARNRYRFIGVERDEDSGLCMTGPRTYDPISGRFLQGDPVVGGAAYVYSRGNPVGRMDPGGYQDETSIADRAITAGAQIASDLWNSTAPGQAVAAYNAAGGGQAGLEAGATAAMAFGPNMAASMLNPDNMVEGALQAATAGQQQFELAWRVATGSPTPGEQLRSAITGDPVSTLEQKASSATSGTAAAAAIGLGAAVTSGSGGYKTVGRPAPAIAAPEMGSRTAPPTGAAGNPVFGPFTHTINKGGLESIIKSGQLRSTTARISAGGGEAVRGGSGEIVRPVEPGGKAVIEFYSSTKPYVHPTNGEVFWHMPEGEVLDIILTAVARPGEPIVYIPR